MSETRWDRWLPALAVVGGTTIAVGLPYVMLAFGGRLAEHTRVGVIVVALVVGGVLVRGGQAVSVDDLNPSSRHPRRDP